MSIRIEDNVNLEHWHTFGVKADARFFTNINNTDELRELCSSRIFNENRTLFLGGGSNILFLHDFEGLVVHMAITGITAEDLDDRYVRVTAGAGVIWDDLVRYCVERGYGGIENLTLIPGTVGAAPIQNIGAYGTELESVFDELEAWDLEAGKFVKFSKKACRFGYRDSYFKNEGKGLYLITSVTLRLSKEPVLNLNYGAIRQVLEENGLDAKNATIADVSRVVEQIRRSKLPDPKKIGNSGSFFKNPIVPEEQYLALKDKYEDIPAYPAGKGLVKVPAGWLIEQCGFKGKRCGNVGVHNRQALVLVNHGGATGREVFELAEMIREQVMDRFGINLEHEVNIIV